MLHILAQVGTVVGAFVVMMIVNACARRNFGGGL
jgi:hypothetical protein